MTCTAWRDWYHLSPPSKGEVVLDVSVLRTSVMNYERGHIGVEAILWSCFFVPDRALFKADLAEAFWFSFLGDQTNWYTLFGLVLSRGDANARRRLLIYAALGGHSEFCA